MLAVALFFSFSGCANHARSKLVSLGITEKKKEKLSLIGLCMTSGKGFSFAEHTQF